jgi:hypothetical protein
MIFSVGTTFIFGSWICDVDDNGKLQSRLMKISTPQVSLDVSMTTLDQLTQTREVIINQDSYSDTSGLEIPFEVQGGDLDHFPLKLKNSTSIYQDTISYIM